MPTVWVSMNGECSSKIPPERAEEGQHTMVEEANKYINARLLKDKVPYWDADAVLRVKDGPHTKMGRCNLSADGVHVATFVDLMRAKMLFNHLCDSDMKWRASINHFMRR